MPSGTEVRSDARPPVAPDPAPASVPEGAPEGDGRGPRPTVARRPAIWPVLDPDRLDGIAADDPYVRRFWSAVIGPTAVGELLRLIVAARRGVAVPRPRRLARLLSVGLVRLTEDGLAVPARIPPLPSSLARSLPPALRVEHRRALTARWSTGSVPDGESPSRRDAAGRRLGRP